MNSQEQEVKERGEAMNEQEHKRGRLKEAFRETQRVGALEFGGQWLAANDAAVSDVTRTAGLFSTADIEVKSLMSIVILSTLRAALHPQPQETK